MTFIEKNVRAAGAGARRPARAARRLPYRREAVRRAGGAPRPGADQAPSAARRIDYAERLTRAALRELPDGEWSFEDWIDDDGVDYGKPIRLFVTIRKPGDHMVVDWTGTNPQVQAAPSTTRCPTRSRRPTRASARCCRRNIPNNEGVFRAIEVICPPGTVGNGVLPAACAARGLTGFRMVDCMFGALAMMLPDKVKAAGDGGNSGISIGGYDADRKPFVYVEFTCGAWGARPWADGLNGNSHMFANMSCTRPRSSRPSSRSPCSPTSSCPTRREPASIRGGVPFQRDYRLNETEGDAAGALRPQDASAVRPLRRQPRPAVRELPQPARREPAAALAR